ncbi:MAG: hypothetical protein OEN55_18800, partial [Alphaproteobacteria bacterium]|nr:hypothetical protein [Alphaproteobacteria bacterium]
GRMGLFFGDIAEHIAKQCMQIRKRKPRGVDLAMNGHLLGDTGLQRSDLECGFREHQWSGGNHDDRRDC